MPESWIIQVLLCPLAGTGDVKCLMAPMQPEPYHYFARERCEKEKKAVRYAGRIPKGYEVVVICSGSDGHE